MERNLYKWRVKIKNQFPEPLATQLVLYASQWDVYDLILEFVFEPTYPMTPPKIRIVEPRFIPGAITNLGPGGVLESPLFRDGGDWTPINTVHNCVAEFVAKITNSTVGKDEATQFLHTHFRSIYTSSEATSQRIGFMQCYQAVSVDDLAGEMGGKVALPSTALHEISSAQNPEFPLIFELKRLDIPSQSEFGLALASKHGLNSGLLPSSSSESTQDDFSLAQSYEDLRSQAHLNLKKTYAGVSTFDAIEGCVLIPSWIMRNLGIVDGALITVRMLSLPKGDFVTLKPHDPEAFLALDQPKEALESVLRSYYALQMGDTLVVPFDGALQYFTVVKTSPAAVIDIKDTDLRLEIQMPSDFDVDKFERSTAPTLKTSNEQSNANLTPSSSNTQISGESATCGNCKRAIPKSSLATHEAFCRRNNVICDMCGQVIRVTDRQAHFEEVHKAVTCVCGEIMELRFLATHKQQECLHRLHTCKFCKLKKKLIDLPEHEDYCGARTEKCLKCQRFVSIKDFAYHTETNCVYPSQPEAPSFFSRVKGFFG